MGTPGPFNFYGIADAGKRANQDIYLAASLENRTMGGWHNLVRYGIARKREQQLLFAPVGLPVVTAVMLETMLLALLGGLLGCAVAWLLFNGYSVSTIGSNFSAVVFKFHVSPELLWTGLKWALGIGLVGGLFPALRAARLPITTALRET